MKSIVTLHPGAPSAHRDADIALGWLLLAGAAYYLLARFGMTLFALKPSNITLIWLPSGLALVMCHRWQWRALPVIFGASLLANYPGMAAGSALAHLLHTAVAAGADTLAGFMTARALRWRLPHGLTRATDLVDFGLWVCLLPTAATSLILTLNLVAGGYIGGGAAPGFFRMLLLADSLGILLVWQVYQGWLSAERLSSDQWQFVLLGTFVLALLLTLDFIWLPGLSYLLILALLAVAFEVGLLGMALLSTLALVAVLMATAQHLGPFVAATPAESNFRVLTFVFATALGALGVTLQGRTLRSTELARTLWQEAAEHDALTGLINRRAFLPRLHQEHERSMRSQRPYSVAMLDLDHFKQINDNHGHANGDLVLRAVAAVLQANCRGIDTVARIGGEEFAIIMPETHAGDARIMLERIRGAVECLPNPIAEATRPVTISIGIAAFDARAASGDALMRHADQALYAAKRHGRNRIDTYQATDIAG